MYRFLYMLQNILSEMEEDEETRKVEFLSFNLKPFLIMKYYTN